MSAGSISITVDEDTLLLFDIEQSPDCDNKLFAKMHKTNHV